MAEQGGAAGAKHELDFHLPAPNPLATGKPWWYLIIIDLRKGKRPQWEQLARIVVFGIAYVCNQRYINIDATIKINPIARPAGPQ